MCADIEKVEILKNKVYKMKKIKLKLFVFFAIIQMADKICNLYVILIVEEDIYEKL